MNKSKDKVLLSTEDYDEILADTYLAGLGDQVGTGQGSTVYLDENGEVDYIDFGLCDWCGMGRYVSRNPNALFGECNYCGAT